MLVLINHLGACVLWWVSADTYISSSTTAGRCRLN
jgi:hypothetical protein